MRETYHKVVQFNVLFSVGGVNWKANVEAQGGDSEQENKCIYLVPMKDEKNGRKRD